MGHVDRLGGRTAHCGLGRGEAKGSKLSWSNGKCCSLVESRPRTARILSVACNPLHSIWQLSESSQEPEIRILEERFRGNATADPQLHASNSVLPHDALLQFAVRDTRPIRPSGRDSCGRSNVRWRTAGSRIVGDPIINGSVEFLAWYHLPRSTSVHPGVSVSSEGRPSTSCNSFDTSRSRE